MVIVTIYPASVHRVMHQTTLYFEMFQLTIKSKSQHPYTPVSRSVYRPSVMHCFICSTSGPVLDYTSVGSYLWKSFKVRQTNY